MRMATVALVTVDANLALIKGRLVAMTSEAWVAVVICLVSAAFVGVVICRRSQVPGAAFWSFAILASVPTAVLLFLPTLLDRLGHIIEVDTRTMKIKLAQTQIVTAEVSASRNEDRVLQLEQTSGKNLPPAAPLPGWHLEQVGFGDCPGREVASTPGAQPVKDQCTSPEMSAVCWDGTIFTNPSQYGGGPGASTRTSLPRNASEACRQDVCISVSLPRPEA
jgi:hypothetical protein